MAAPNYLKMTTNTGILQAGGQTIVEAANLHGADNSGELHQEVVVQANHFNVPELWGSWLRKCKLLTVSQIGAACTIEGLKD